MRRASKRKKRRGVRVIKMDQEMHDAFLQQRERFRQRFGRDPGPEDPVFFDPRSDTPVPIDLDYYLSETTAAMERAGLDPKYIYAFRRTGGLIVTESNSDKLPAEDIEAWNRACEEYEELLAKGLKQ